MDRVQTQFSDQVDYFILNVDEPSSRPYLEQFVIRDRSTYVLLDADGNELKRWVGRLNEAAMVADIEATLAEQGVN